MGNAKRRQGDSLAPYEVARPTEAMDPLQLDGLLRSAGSKARPLSPTAPQHVVKTAPRASTNQPPLEVATPAADPRRRTLTIPLLALLAAVTALAFVMYTR